MLTLLLAGVLTLLIIQINLRQRMTTDQKTLEAKIDALGLLVDQIKAHQTQAVAPVDFTPLAAKVDVITAEGQSILDALTAPVAASAPSTPTPTPAPPLAQ